MPAASLPTSSSPRSLSCLVLGEEPLAARCADVLLERGHRVVGIVTAARAVMRWAEDHGVPVVRRADYPALLERDGVDLLLSITHPALIAASSIARARVGAFNYHDGPLPRYAGMNGSAWALHNGEAAHAIVWHHLTAGLDAGDIVERADVTLDARETSLSLNMGNSVRAFETFGALVRRIERGELAGTPQRTDVPRLELSRHDRPPSLCVMDWRAPAAALDRLVRACEFGAYPNRFGAAKVVHRGRALIVRDAAPVAAPGGARPGDVVAVDGEGFTVACGEGALRLRRFTTLAGEPLAPARAAERLGVREGASLLEDVERAGGLADAATSRAIAEGEQRFVTALATRVTASLPIESTKAQRPCRVDVPLPRAFLERWQGRLDDAVAALEGFTLSCLVREDVVDLALVDGPARAPYAAHEAVLFPSVPLRVRVDAAAGFEALVRGVAAARAGLPRVPVFLYDLVARHPSLRDQPELRAGALANVALVLDSSDPARLPPGAALGLTLERERLTLCSDGRVPEPQLRALADQLVTVAARVAADPERALRHVDLLDDASRQRQVFGWNATAAPFSDALRIHDLFERQAAERPDAIALVFEDTQVTFRDLEARANRVANAVRARGAGPGDYVAILVERGVDLVAALLGVAKAGAAYLPIDPGYPVDRIRFMLDDAACKVVVASPEHAPLAVGDDEDSGAAGGALLLVDGPEVTGASPERAACPSASSDVCYAIYTSGSTGRPKGVVLTHAAVVNTLEWVNRTFEVGPADRLLWVTSPSFDLSVFDVFGALGAGACVDVASSALLKDPEALLRRVRDGGITIWDSAPPALARLAAFFPERAPERGGARSDDPALRLVMLSGDWIPVWLPDAVRSAFPRAVVKSLGGATEAAIWSNYFHVNDVDPAWASIPYGYPIQNARYYVLDQHKRPVPPGIPGDLYIAGTCLAQGYLHRAELTAERFVADPFVPGERMYATGDLAKYWDDGTMEFLGRADFQVKIRGFRVEMGEVESALRALPGVRDAVCSTWVDGAAQKSLVAYLVPKPGAREALDARAVKEQLAARLPDFMVPSHVIVLDALPLSANGKLDRKALPSPADEKSATAFVAPRTDAERALAAIWEDVLQRKPIGVHDEFMDVGGHSLLAVMLMAQIKQRMGVEVPLSRILEHPTVEKLAASIAAPGSAPSRMVIQLKRGGPRALFLVHDGDGETLLYRTLAQRLPEDLTVYGLAPRALPGVPLADTSIEEMARTYVAQVRRQQPHGPYALGGLCAGGVIAFEMALQLEAAGEEVALVALLDAVQPTTPRRLGRTASRRWRRLAALFDENGAGGAQAEPRRAQRVAALELFQKARAVARKVQNATSYEVGTRFRRAAVSARYRLLLELLARGRPWPRRLPPLSVREIYEHARDAYAPRGLLRTARVLLVKATESTSDNLADEPAARTIVDPLLGWASYVARGSLDAIEMPGGHSSMLQEPHVDVLAHRLAATLGGTALTAPERGEPERGEPARAPRRPRAGARMLEDVSDA